MTLSASRLRQSVASGRLGKALVFHHLIDNDPTLLVVQRVDVMNLEIIGVTGGLVVKLKSTPALPDKPQGRGDVLRSKVAVPALVALALRNFTQFPNQVEVQGG
jgi:hypothetical protein